MEAAIGNLHTNEHGCIPVNFICNSGSGPDLVCRPSIANTCFREGLSNRGTICDTIVNHTDNLNFSDSRILKSPKKQVQLILIICLCNLIMAKKF